MTPPVRSPSLTSPDVTSAGSTAPITAAPTDSSTDTTTEPPVVADTGVPGLDSDDEFCRSWSEFAGTFQALALSASLAAEPSQWARPEVAAASTIVAAVAGLHEHLPDELEPEREALAVGLVGPLARRAGEAIVALTAAGLTEAEIAAVGEVWLATLTAAGLDEPIADICRSIPTSPIASTGQSARSPRRDRRSSRTRPSSPTPRHH